MDLYECMGCGDVVDNADTYCGDCEKKYEGDK